MACPQPKRKSAAKVYAADTSKLSSLPRCCDVRVCLSGIVWCRRKSFVVVVKLWLLTSVARLTMFCVGWKSCNPLDYHRLMAMSALHVVFVFGQIMIIIIISSSEACVTDLVLLECPHPTVKFRSWRMEAVEPSPIWCSEVCVRHAGAFTCPPEGISQYCKHRHTRGCLATQPSHVSKEAQMTAGII